MYRNIWRIAVPSIVSNITVPLLGLADTAIVGHLGSPAYIGAIAVGGMVFNMVYWLFAFLRMGTGGLTAQAYGRGDKTEVLRALCRSLGVALGAGLLLIALQGVLTDVAFRLVSASPDVEVLARRYFNILIWGAPVVLAQYGLTGWFLGMQNARFPMYIAIVQNVVNIAVSLILVAGIGLKVEGVALGTLTAQYVGLSVGFALWWKRYHASASGILHLKGVWKRSALAHFLGINRDIFLRTLCLVGVTTSFTSAGTAQGELVLAANTLLMQFFVLFSYFMDGFAYAAEALGGRYVGARNVSRFRSLARLLFVTGGGLAILFAGVYALGGAAFLRLLTGETAVVETAVRYLPAIAVLPLLSFGAFLFDGLFIGATATREMLLSMTVATAAFFLVNARFPPDNAVLWVAFLTYLALRGLMQAFFFRRVMRRAF